MRNTGSSSGPWSTRSRTRTERRYDGGMGVCKADSHPASRPCRRRAASPRRSRELPMRRLKISGCTANFGRADLFRIVDRLTHHGYDGVEITVMYHAPPDETSAGRRREIKDHIRQSGLAISALHFIFPPEMRMASDDRGE